MRRLRRTRRPGRAASADTLRGATAGRAPADAALAGDGRCVPPDAGRIAAHIGDAALELAKQANRAGLTGLGYLLESAALEAGAEAASRAWGADSAEH